MTDGLELPYITIGPRVRKSPYFDATLRHGARAFTIYNHMYMPTLYAGPEAEYWSLVNDVTLWDVACQRQIEISGPDAFDLVQFLTPRDMSRCKVGQCQYMLLTDAAGGIINDAILLRVGEDRFWLSPGDGDVLVWVLGVAVNSGMDVNVFEPDVSPLQLQGPKSPQVAKQLFGNVALELKYYWLAEVELDGIPLIISRTGWSGELGYEIYLRDRRFGDTLWETVMEAGREFNIAPITPSTIRSIEGGLLSYFSDISRDDNPFVFGFDAFIDFDQCGDFIGKTALQEIKANGVERRFVGVEIDGDPITHTNTEFWKVKLGQEIVGHLTRCIYSPRLERNIGFANVPTRHAGSGKNLALISPTGERTATVCKWPWFPAQKKIPAELLS
ncbi:MAG: glycine cleavage T C-terminal barrel domain-containing protein [Woeseiaceae bacterium]